GGHEIADPVRDPLPPRRGVSSASDLMAGAPQCLGEDGANAAIVIGYQYRSATHLSGLLVAGHRQHDAKHCPPGLGIELDDPAMLTDNLRYQGKAQAVTAGLDRHELNEQRVYEKLGDN